MVQEQANVTADVSFRLAIPPPPLKYLKATSVLNHSQLLGFIAI